MAETKIMIVAGEASGDLHGAHLVAAIKKENPEATFCGIGGNELKGQGVEILYDAAKLAVVGIIEVISHFKYIRQAMAALEQRLKSEPPDLLILIDYPDFNFHLAKKAKKLNIPIFYYISPQVWAWRSGRVKTIKKLVNRMAVILPFEKDFYAARDMEVDFVGHPLMDSVKTSMAKAEFLAQHRIDPTSTIIGLLPGSRKREVAAMLPVFLEAAKLIKTRVKKPVFLLPLASTLSLADLRAHGLADCEFEVKVIAENRYDMMAACQMVMAASGTVTLELAILDVPMLVSYQVSPLTYLMARHLIKIKYASLVNLVADREVVPELLQKEATPDNLARHGLELLTDTKSREEMLNGLAEVRAKLGGAGASARAARIALATAR
ncbi:MAG: lipid-A-disaccharide synthase [Desulfobulbaceae bacterium]|nr:lipid-A-disaccharide synthase [Desulfobulbaceae bacterium]HIJ79820.1 lipid-A-disaccharide synthase [Deltaproteobacteria bacterium]